jgi:hypothetical protein
MRRLFYAFGLWAILSSGASAGQTGHVVTDYAQNMSYFPAAISAIHFASADIDLHHTIQWDQWTVGFGGAIPTATPFQGQGPVNSFEIPLQCQNPLTGALPCALEVVETRWGVPVCRIRDGDHIDFSVDCPKSLELQP